MKEIARNAAFLLTMMVLSFYPSTCHAEARCLWLNTATASGFLGGDVETIITPLSPPGDETCEFSRKLGTAVLMLRIVVHTMDEPSKDYASYLAQCGGASAPLKGIGNEAVQCLKKSGSGGGEEMVIGRVRERAFIVTVSRTDIAQSVTLNGLREDTRNIAEQVAGSLF